MTQRRYDSTDAPNAMNAMNDAKTQRLMAAVIPQTDRIDQTVGRLLSNFMA